mmetsp:Transcript_40574/g.112682  ORF Transcript_40574/g.112682 Transcript_40574/m.112682 type:complete len:221 (-) Transcript_40574:272-934(-)|eukprot:CAMPEP_0179089980 /NCGR_PEP_ID=MMETSP0796-20121207/41027_1 /TAXON_ID=73915 /ORGANISM="Pyrodinium bahamense, Strain pbaha01" /LENGTH=220 /DNA_ID=CAMNT_0020787543 /DNA_START=72 /DNA_END=734 /DNA_ORIENTATION=-
MGSVCGASSRSEPAARSVRVIGMDSGITAAQVQTAATFIADFRCVDWDGDQVKTGCFTEAIVGFLERAKDDSSLKVVARCLPGQDGTYTQKGNLAVDAVPRAQAISQEQFAAATDFLTSNLGKHWEAAMGSSAQYAVLAAAGRISEAPSSVLWLLDDDRPRNKYVTWVCLAEYKAFAGSDSHYTLVGRDGRILTQKELTDLPWFGMSAADIGWDVAPASQ